MLASLIYQKEGKHLRELGHEETTDEKENTSELESNNKNDSNTKNIDKDIVEVNDSQLEDLIKERDELKDKLMRALAESENIRKRSFKDRQDAEIYAVSKMSRDILSVFDNLQRALDLADDILDEKSFLQNLALLKGNKSQTDYESLLNVVAEKSVANKTNIINELYKYFLLFYDMALYIYII